MKYGAILADPPWPFATWGDQANAATDVERHYRTMSFSELRGLPIAKFAAPDCVLFCWACWPSFPQAIETITEWGFRFKTMGFMWVKGNALPMFPEDVRDQMGTGYWTRSNSEPCILATRGKPKRVNADVRQVIIEPRREHSRKPDCVYERIERLVEGPYLELFARSTRKGWDAWGNEVGKFGEVT